MHKRGVSHRDIKCENVLIDQNLKLKLADFGFAAYKKINKLSSFKGTFTYMAPEIKEGKVYDGEKIDIFSLGVVLHIIVKGIFPFQEARRDNYFYNLLMTGQDDIYWDKISGTNLSPEYKDLFMRMISYDPALRPTPQEIRAHPWMNCKGYNPDEANYKLYNQICEAQQNQKM